MFDAPAGWRPVPEHEARILPITPEPTRKPVLALAICGAVLLVPLLLSAPGAAPRPGQEVALAVVGPEGGAADQPGNPNQDLGLVGPTEPTLALARSQASLRPPTKKRSASAKPVSAKARVAAAASAKRKVSTTTSTTSPANANTAAVAEVTASARPAPTSPPPTAAPAPAPAPPPPPAPAPSSGDSAWDRLAQCESSNTNDGGAPYYGYWQFSADTWHRMGETGLPNEFSREHQLEVAKRLQAASGWGQWPDCARRLGLR